MEKEIKELTLLLLYLTSWEEDAISEKVKRSWKGYPFEILDELNEENLLFGSKRGKSVYFTEEGIKKAEKLMKKYLDQGGFKIVAPRRKRYNRKQRLTVAEKWVPTYEGKNIVKGYSKWFGVDKVYAITELELLGYEIDPKYKEQILKQHKAKSKAGEKKKREEKSELAPWQDSNFYFIAGYTSGGAPYGITWEEYERDIKEDDEDNKDGEKHNVHIETDNNDFLDGDIPF